MKKYRRYIIGVILLGTLLLSILLNQYKFVEEQLNLENNKLYSHNSRVIESINVIGNNKEVQRYSFRVFGEFQETPLVRAYYSNDYKNWKPNLKEGDFFDKADTHEAIVGKDVQLVEEGDTRYYVYNKKVYKVIGYFGITENSFMDNQVVINDSSYFTDKSVKTVLDSDYIEKFKENGIEFLDVPIKDIWNPINDQFFTKWIIKLGKWLSILVFVLCGIIYSLQFRKESEIKYLMGIKKYKIWIKKLSHLSLLFLLIFSIVMGSTYLAAPELIKLDIIMKNIVNYFILIICFMLNELFLEWRRLRCGN